MTDQASDPYAQKHLSHATPAELTQYAALLEGKLPKGFDSSRAEDWIAAIGRLAAASGARQRAAVVQQELAEPDEAVEGEPLLNSARPVIQGLPFTERSTELALARRWMNARHELARETYFDHQGLAPAPHGSTGLPPPG